MDPLLCSTIVYRPLLRKNWWNKTTNQVLPAAFVRRPKPKDPNGISVGYRCSPEQYAGRFRETFGIVSLHVGSVRNIGLDVIPDEKDECHANITGVPYQEEDPVLAERLASLLAKQSRPVPPSSPTT